MNVADLVSIALANFDEDRVDVMALESAEFGEGILGALSEIVTELTGNALEHGEGEPARLAGLWEGDGYLISISDRGHGMAEEDLSRYNTLLRDFSEIGRYSGGSLGLPIVSRLAARHGLRVQLVPGAPGISARVRIPPIHVRSAGETPSVDDANHPVAMEPLDPDAIDDVFNPYRYPSREPENEPMASPAGSEAEAPALIPPSTASFTDEEMEDFLESIFAPIVGSGHRTTGTWDLEMPHDEPGLATITKLRVRVPGHSYTVSDDSPSTASAERAIEIRKALSSFDAGRKSASSRSDL